MKFAYPRSDEDWFDFDCAQTHLSCAIEQNPADFATARRIVSFTHRWLRHSTPTAPNHLTWIERELFDHALACIYVRTLVDKPVELSPETICLLQKYVVLGFEKDAGQLRQSAIWVGEALVPYHHDDLPALMDEFCAWLKAAPHNPETAFMAQLKLLDIHPFTDGNGRTARLLTNLLLLQNNQPPVVVPKPQHPRYQQAVKTYCQTKNSAPFMDLVRR